MDMNLFEKANALYSEIRRLKDDYDLPVRMPTEVVGYSDAVEVFRLLWDKESESIIKFFNDLLTEYKEKRLKHIKELEDEFASL